MSVSSWITIKLCSENLPLSSIVDALLSSGWSAAKNGEMVFLPLGDHDTFDWTKRLMKTSELSALAQQKFEAKELFGVELHWRDTDNGGNFLLELNSIVRISLSMSRVILKQSPPHTDVSWYLERILPAVNKLGGARTIEWSENL